MSTAGTGMPVSEHRADVRYEVRAGAAGAGWQAVYKFESALDGWQLVAVLPPGHLRVLGEAVNKVVREGAEIP